MFFCQTKYIDNSDQNFSFVFYLTKNSSKWSYLPYQLWAKKSNLVYALNMSKQQLGEKQLGVFSRFVKASYLIRNGLVRDDSFDGLLVGSNFRQKGK